MYEYLLVRRGEANITERFLNEYTFANFNSHHVGISCAWKKGNNNNKNIKKRAIGIVRKNI